MRAAIADIATVTISMSTTVAAIWVALATPAAMRSGMRIAEKAESN